MAVEVSMSRLRSAVLLASLCSVICACNLLDEGTWVPEDPGTVSATVRDASGFPVRDALVEVEIPNSVGGVFQHGTRTNSEGRATIRSVPAGTRPVRVTPPAGFHIGAAGREQLVDVRRHQTVSVTFILIRE
jgi:hypothetical protein